MDKLATSVIFLLLNMSIPGLVHAQYFTGDSIPEPTQLSSLVSKSGVEIVKIGNPGRIESSNSTAEISAIEVVAYGGDRQRGAKLVLESPEQSDWIYMDVDEISQLRDEFVNFDSWYETGMQCEAISMCIFGVARCRPSQAELQAYCPAVYSTPDGKLGLWLSTPRGSFQFPSLRTDVIIDAINKVIHDLSERERQNHQDQMELRDRNVTTGKRRQYQ